MLRLMYMQQLLYTLSQADCYAWDILCGAGHWGYYIRLLSQKINLPCGSAGLFFVYLSDGFVGMYTEGKKQTVQIHLFFTHPSVLLIKTTRSR